MRACGKGSGLGASGSTFGTWIELQKRSAFLVSKMMGSKIWV